jgi:hypothetical protein
MCNVAVHAGYETTLSSKLSQQLLNPNMSVRSWVISWVFVALKLTSAATWYMFSYIRRHLPRFRTSSGEEVVLKMVVSGFSESFLHFLRFQGIFSWPLYLLQKGKLLSRKCARQNFYRIEFLKRLERNCFKTVKLL